MERKINGGVIVGYTAEAEKPQEKKETPAPAETKKPAKKKTK